MGKTKSKRECGSGIYQRKDGRYYARLYLSDGKRTGKYFKTLSEAQDWLDEQKSLKRDGRITASSYMTVDQWFEYWEKT